MNDFILKQLPYDLSNQAGLALIGKYLKRININSLVDPAFSVRSGIACWRQFKIDHLCQLNFDQGSKAEHWMPDGG